MKKIQDYFRKDVDLNANESISENALWLLNQRYFIERYDAEIKAVRKEKTFAELARRVAKTIASAETEYSNSVEWVRTLEKNITSDILNRRFLFNSPCLFDSGVGLAHIPEFAEIIYKEPDATSLEEYKSLYWSKTENQQLFACFVVDVPDSIEGIFDSVKNAGIISKFGGGVGANFGNVREMGANIANGVSGKASGPISFMETWNTMGSVVVQGGKRRAALMGMMSDDHPDIEKFIDCKTEDGRLSYFNISVAVSDKLMKAAENDEDFDLHSRVDRSVVKTVKAKDLLNHIYESAWQRGDPGIFFIDRARQDNILKMGAEEWDIEATNPCGEQPLPNYTSCNLGSINLEKFVKNGFFNYEEFEAQIYRSFYYLDLVIDACVYPLKKIEERTKAIRPVGLGIMGLADASIMQNIIYGSKKFNDFCMSIGEFLARTALLASIKIVTEAGKPPFNESHLVQKLFEKTDLISCDKNTPLTLGNILGSFTDDNEFNFVIEQLKAGNLRNSRRLSIAPTGSISMILDTSSGIEPNFAWSWNRRITKTDGTGFENREYWHKLLTQEQREEYKKDGNIKNPLFVSAHDVSTEQHVNVVGIFAQFVDSAISKTVNLPNSATVEDVKNVYKKCYELGCKGITIYRDGSRSYQPIEIKHEVKKEIKPQVKERPDFIVFGKTIKDKTPYGNIYLTLNFDGKEPFEVFVNIGKSGSELKAMTEALSRVISIGLRSGCRLEDFIDTLKGLSGKEYWILNCDDDKIVRSIPDAVALLLEKLINRKNMESSKKLICPECGAPLEKISGCEYCFSCGYSPCK